MKCKNLSVLTARRTALQQALQKVLTDLGRAKITNPGPVGSKDRAEHADWIATLEEGAHELRREIAQADEEIHQVQHGDPQSAIRSLTLLTGLILQFRDDGTYLNFVCGAGHQANIRLESLGEGDRILSGALRGWCHERRQEFEPSKQAAV